MYIEIVDSKHRSTHESIEFENSAGWKRAAHTDLLQIVHEPSLWFPTKNTVFIQLIVVCLWINDDDAERWFA